MRDNITGLDVVMVIVGIIITASAPTLLIALPLFFVGCGIHIFANSPHGKAWGNHLSDNVMSRLPQLPAPKTKDDVLQLNTPVKTENEQLRDIPWSKRITGEHQMLDVGSAIQPTGMANILQIMPKKIPYDHPKLPNAPTPTSVLIGYDPTIKNWVWADFGVDGGDTIHAFVAGQTRAGKDSLIRFWFTQLTSNNTPEQIKFIIIDAKGEWATPALKDASHMFIPPVGDFELQIEVQNGKRKLVDKANERIEDALITTIELLNDRMKEFQRVGAINLASYQNKTGKKLPLLFVVITDVGTNLEGMLEHLVKFLVFKGGSIGVRAIISMQTASGQDTGWRGQMGLTMSGYQSQSSADAPNMGMPVKALKYRPSELPSPDVPENRGLFVVRKGIQQYVVRTAFLPDNIFESYCEQRLPRKNAFNPIDLLDSLLMHDLPVVVKKKVKAVLTVEQAKLAANLAQKGISASKITHDYLKFTNGDRYAEVLPHVEIICNAIQRKLLK